MNQTAKIIGKMLSIAGAVLTLNNKETESNTERKICEKENKQGK